VNVLLMLSLLKILKYPVYGKKSFLSKQSDTLRSYRVYISPMMQASSALIQIESSNILFQK